MKKERIRLFIGAISTFTAFIAWTAAVCFIDRQAIGPLESTVGLATLNRFIHDLTGVHFSLYLLTDWFGLVPIAIIIGFAAVGMFQWIKRRRISRVDKDLLILGLFYAFVASVYIFFEVFPVNYRPVLINGRLEASYPSSTTMLMCCVMPTAIIRFNACIKSIPLKRFTAYAISAFAVLTVVFRLICGVHWFTDIVGGLLFSTALLMAYLPFSSLEKDIQ